VPELAHDTEDGFHEIQLSGKQLVFLFGTASAVLVVTFLCGVLVGRNAQLNSSDAIDSPTASAPSPSATPSTPITSADAGPRAAEPPAPPKEDELTYDRRLRGNPAPEQLKPKPAEPAPKPPAAVPPRQADPGPVDVPTAGKPGTWFVQVNALQNRTAATDIVKSLIKKGYPAYLELPPKGTPAIYRIRVGRYNDRRDAEQAAKRLKEDKFSPDVRR
jgi:cell division septation protein DedD